MSLAPYVLKGVKRAATGLFGATTTSGINTRSVTTGITASTTHSIAGGTPLTAEFNYIGTCANIGDAVTLPALSPGQAVEVWNAGANAAAVYPAASGVTIDGGSAGASVTLSSTKRAKFLCVAAGVIVSAQLGVASA